MVGALTNHNAQRGHTGDGGAQKGTKGGWGMKGCRGEHKGSAEGRVEGWGEEGT